MVSFIGRLSDRAALEARRAGVSELVRTSEPIPRAELLKHLVDADALLLPSQQDTDSNALPMKLFEYVGAGRPIILFGAADHLARMVPDLGLGIVVPDADGLERRLRDLVAGGKGLPVAGEDARARLDRQTSLRELAALVDEL